MITHKFMCLNDASINLLPLTLDLIAPGSENSIEGELMDELEAEFTEQLDEAADGDRWCADT